MDGTPIWVNRSFDNKYVLARRPCETTCQDAIRWLRLALDYWWRVVAATQPTARDISAEAIRCNNRCISEFCDRWLTAGSSYNKALAKGYLVEKVKKKSINGCWGHIQLRWNEVWAEKKLGGWTGFHCCRSLSCVWQSWYCRFFLCFREVSQGQTVSSRSNITPRWVLRFMPFLSGIA